MRPSRIQEFLHMRVIKLYPDKAELYTGPCIIIPQVDCGNNNNIIDLFDGILFRPAYLEAKIPYITCRPFDSRGFNAIVLATQSDGSLYFLYV